MTHNMTDISLWVQYDKNKLMLTKFLFCLFGNNSWHIPNKNNLALGIRCMRQKCFDIPLRIVQSSQIMSIDLRLDEELIFFSALAIDLM